MRYPTRYYRNVKQALKSLIEASLAIQSSNFGMGLPFGTCLRDLCTIRVRGPRQCGHTTAIYELGKEMFDKPIFLFPNEELARNFRRRFDVPWKSVRTFGGSMFAEHLRGIDTDAVFVDLACIMPKEKEEALKKVCEGFLASKDAFCLVLVS